jgi:hypothetical protein
VELIEEAVAARKRSEIRPSDPSLP